MMNQVERITLILKLYLKIQCLCDCSNVYILVKSVIAVENTAAADADTNNTNKKVIFKNCAPFTTFIAG